MKRWGKTVTAIAAINCGVLAGSMLTSLANSIPPAGQPGSSEDPVVTKSYVDEQIRKALGGQVPEQTGGSTGEIGQGNEEFKIIVVKPGETLLGGKGADFIVRAGQAIVYSNSQNGIADLTDGKDLTNGVKAPNNHLLSIPREGRGVKVDAKAKSEAVVTVKGSYLHLGKDGKEVQEKTP